MDPAGRVGLFSSAFGPVPATAVAHVAAMDRATVDARASHPGWFDRQHCSDDSCPETHCPVELGRGPYLFTWDEEHDDRYTRYGVPTTAVHVSEMTARVADAARLIKVGLSFDGAARIHLSRSGEWEALSGCAQSPAGRSRPHL
ncbi:hypothetical protein [Streptomyces sp. NPDC001889]